MIIHHPASGSMPARHSREGAKPAAPAFRYNAFF